MEQIFVQKARFTCPHCGEHIKLSEVVELEEEDEEDEEEEDDGD